MGKESFANKSEMPEPHPKFGQLSKDFQPLQQASNSW